MMLSFFSLMRFAAVLCSNYVCLEMILVWKEFVWGAMAGAFGEGMMHPVDTVKTRIQSQVFLSGAQVSPP